MNGEAPLPGLALWSFGLARRAAPGDGPDAATGENLESAVLLDLVEGGDELAVVVRCNFQTRGEFARMQRSLEAAEQLFDVAWRRDF